jgi:hypothetical protein
VYKTQNEDKYPFFITITELILVFVLFLVHNVACVSVLSISDCSEEWILVFVLCLVHNVDCVSTQVTLRTDTERRQVSILHYNHL